MKLFDFINNTTGYVIVYKKDDVTPVVHYVPNKDAADTYLSEVVKSHRHTMYTVKHFAELINGNIEVTKKLPDPVKQDRYLTDKEGKDFIDESFETDSFNDFTAAIFWTMRKYMKRFGKKDALSSESGKILDYAQRFHSKVLEYEQKNKKS